MQAARGVGAGGLLEERRGDDADVAFEVGAVEGVEAGEREGDGGESARYAFEGSGLERGDDSGQARQCDRQQRGSLRGQVMIRRLDGLEGGKQN